MLAVIVHNMDLAAWCKAHPERRMDPKREFGRLLAVLDRLREHYGADARAEGRQ